MILPARGAIWTCAAVFPAFRRIKGVQGHSGRRPAGQRAEGSAKPEKSLVTRFSHYHRREDRIRAHIILCWLALLLIRVAENETGRPWNRIRAELQRLHEHHRLVTRPVTGIFSVPAASCLFFGH